MNRARQIRLLEVGLTLPLETFLVDKLEGLALRGFQIDVSAVAGDAAPQAGPVGVKMISAPATDERLPRLVRGVLADGVRLALRRPAALPRTIRAALLPIGTPPGNRGLLALHRLRSYLPLAAMKPDVVHFEWSSAAIFYLPMVQVWGCPTVLSCRGSNINVLPHGPRAAPYRRWMREVFERVDATHCVSDAVAGQAVELGMDPRRAWLIRPAVDVSRFRPSPTDGEPVAGERPVRRLRILSVGDLRWLKGHEYSIRTLALLRQRGVPAELEIVGGAPSQAAEESSDRPRISAAIERSQLSGHVRLSGALHPGEVRRRLRSADVLLHSSVSEGLPNAVLEAMACGRPVVVTDCGGTSEAVQDGIDGFVVPPRGVQAAADALTALYQDESLRVRMGQAGRERARAHFSLSAQLEELARMYRAVCAGATASAGPPRVAGATRLHLLSVGPMVWTQGFEDAIESVRLVIDRGVPCELRIFGDGEHATAIWFARRQLGLQASVRLRSGEELSHLASDRSGPEEEQLRRLERCAQWQRELRWADALLDCSLLDPASAALRAARAAGLPVVSVSGDPAALAEAIVELAGLGAAPTEGAISGSSER